MVRTAAALIVLLALVESARADEPTSQPVAASQPVPAPATLAARVEVPSASRPALVPAAPPKKKKNKLVYAIAAGGVLVAIGLVVLAGTGSSTQRIEVKWP